MITLHCSVHTNQNNKSSNASKEDDDLGRAAIRRVDSVTSSVAKGPSEGAVWVRRFRLEGFRAFISLFFVDYNY